MKIFFVSLGCDKNLSDSEHMLYLLHNAGHEITDFEEVVKLDTEYINNWSIGLDVRILLKTVKAVLKHEGAM